MKSVDKEKIDDMVSGKNPPGKNPPGKNPLRRNPPENCPLGKDPPRKKSPGKKSPILNFFYSVFGIFELIFWWCSGREKKGEGTRLK